MWSSDRDAGCVVRTCYVVLFACACSSIFVWKRDARLASRRLNSVL
jgi:hypothetical protein